MSEDIENKEEVMEETKEELEQDMGFDRNKLKEGLEGFKELQEDEDNMEFREWNDTAKEWLKDYEETIDKALETEEITRDDYELTKDNLLKLKESFVTEEYVENLLEYFNDKDISFVEEETTVKRKSKSFTDFIKRTAKQKSIGPGLFMKLTDLKLKKICETDKEKDIFKSLLYEVSKHESVRKSKLTRQRFLYLFLKSMDKYSRPLFNGIAKRYINEYGDGEIEQG